MASIRRPERDACGIGFVAYADGSARREIVETALSGLRGVQHRGAVGADARSGDGAGLLVALPQAFFAAEAAAAGLGDPPGQLGVVMAFLPRHDEARARARGIVADALREFGLQFLGWRTVPVEPDVLGRQARAVLPAIDQALFTAAADQPAHPQRAGRPQVGAQDDTSVERRAYLARRWAERACAEQDVAAYFASWSTRTVTYKAMSAADQLAAFYPDLLDPRFTAWFGVFHQRFSTNTLPTWERAQPFRQLCHNGEINTIQGNENLMRARTGRLGANWPELDGHGETLLEPIIDPSASDSAKLDNVAELLMRGGRRLEHAMAMLVPQVWEGQRELPAEVRDFYRYHAALIEPWDGPAGLVATDGLRVSASLDRNGLRPLRYAVCEDGFVTAASEVGAVATDGHGRVRRARLGPGEMLLVDPARGGVIEDAAVKRALAQRRPYGAWLDGGQRRAARGHPLTVAGDSALQARQVCAGFTKEEQTAVLRPLANDAKEPVSSMGDDTPLASLSAHRRPVQHFLKQRFAQVTNPAIDHLREREVMSLRTQLGPRGPLLAETPEAARLIELDGFLLHPSGLQELLLDPPIPLATAGLDATFAVDAAAPGLAERLDALAHEAVAAVRSGAGLLVLSDRAVDRERAPVPALLAVGAVHHRLVAEGLRTATSLVCEHDDARDTHTFALLLGYGADVICPRLALETIADLADAGRLGRDGRSAGQAQEALFAAASDGVLKIMSKMGISTLDSYRSAQVFEAVGLADDVLDTCLAGTPCQLGGIGLVDLGADVLVRHAAAFGPKVTLESPGQFKYRKGGEYHSNNPDTIGALHDTVGLTGELAALGSPRGDTTQDGSSSAELTAARLLAEATAQGRWDRYATFARLVNERPPSAPRDMLALREAARPIDLDEVEPATAIAQRFFSGAMSLGALSPESHEDLAVALNLIGGRSNTGEGGEDPRRFRTRGQQPDRNSRAKQVASGRFGVTPQYLAYADEVQIKIAQGSKPGEGGHLPGHKASDLIARLRHTQPGVALISPPPHHDIYSIEDLAQLIYDLKQVNPFAAVNVKLVASEGVGVVAAGVVKGLADAVQIAGADGGTGASPLSSIKHAGLPWEVGVADAHRTLTDNGLRSRVRLQVDGGLRTGRDVLIAALLGADEYGFGTIALIAQGCVMARACHRDTCPVGIATQRPDLRAKYAGTPEMVAAYLLFVAEEVRLGLAALGLPSVDEAIGRTDLLSRRTDEASGAPVGRLDVQALLGPPARLAAPHDGTPSPAPAEAATAVTEGSKGSEGSQGSEGTTGSQGSEGTTGTADSTDTAYGGYVGSVPAQFPRAALGDRVLEAALPVLFDGGDAEFTFPIGNADRSVGARLGGAVALEFGDEDGVVRPLGQVTVRFHGAAGQSFGAFLTPATTFVLTGEANDYVGKGLAGGRLVVRPPAVDDGDPVLVGNTVLYGATAGALFVAGRAGERFCVRNSGADAVIEGVGDHACEYMTGGTVVILGATGSNLGAGMTGGACFVHDASTAILGRVNTELVDARRASLADLDHAHDLLTVHAEATGSPRAGDVLARWDEVAPEFWKIAPHQEGHRRVASPPTALRAPA